jgi:O-antigen/teichoic acid export membrane protein
LFSFVRNNIKSEFGRNVLTLFTGTTISQVIPFIISPILTRLYSPEDFGLLALFVSVFSIVSIIVTLQYEAAIVLPKEDSDAASLVRLCLILTSAITIISLLISIFFNNTITRWLGDDNLSYWLYFVPIPVFLTGIYNTLNYWATRKKQYKRLAYRTISQSTTTGGLKVLFGFIGAVRSGLITATLIGQTTATTVLAWFTWKDDKKILRNVSKKDMLKNAVAYKDFPKYTAWQGFFDMFNASGTTFLISAFFGSLTLGLYSFTLSLLQKPMQLIGNSVAQVYYQKASELYNEGNNIWEITKKLLIRLTIIALIIFTPLAIAGPKLFSFVFGKNWYDAGIYAQLLLPWMVVRFIGSPITSCINILGKQKEFLYYTIFINVIFPTILFLALKLKLTFEIALLCVSILTGIYVVLQILWIRKLLRIESCKRLQ